MRLAHLVVLCAHPDWHSGQPMVTQACCSKPGWVSVTNGTRTCVVAAARLVQQHLLSSGVVGKQWGPAVITHRYCGCSGCWPLIVVKVVDAGPAQHTGCGKHPVLAGHDPQGVG